MAVVASSRRRTSTWYLPARGGLEDEALGKALLGAPVLGPLADAADLAVEGMVSIRKRDWGVVWVELTGRSRRRVRGC